MRGVIQDLFHALLAVLIPLASFTTGLQAPRSGLAQERLWRRPGVLVRELLAVLVLVPLWVLLLVSTLPLTPAVRAGLLIATIAVGVGPVASLKRMSGASAAARDALDLNLVVLILSLAFVPIAFALLARLYRADIHLGVWPVAKVVLGRALLPLVLGLGLARAAPRFAATAGPWLMKIVNVALLVLVIVAIAATWKFLVHVGGAAWLACGLAVVGAIAIGHALGGPDPSTRGVAAAASAMRFPALALVLAAVIPRGQRVIPVVLVYAIVSMLAVTVYGLLMSRRQRRRRKVEAARPVSAAPRTA